MISPGVYVIYFAAILMAAFAVSRRDKSLNLGLTRAIEQFVRIVPRMICALVAAGFMVKFIPTEVIGRFLGVEAGFTGILIGSVTGLLVPSGPVIAFAIAAAFANEGASVPALVSFITCWTLYAAHRIIIFEVPLLGFSFLRLRVLSVMILPFLAGTMALLATELLSYVTF
jgi:uncharacterized membrane protein YraQ (UPF0718 family)